MADGFKYYNTHESQSVGGVNHSCSKPEHSVYHLETNIALRLLTSSKIDQNAFGLIQSAHCLNQFRQSVNLPLTIRNG